MPAPDSSTVLLALKNDIHACESLLQLLDIERQALNERNTDLLGDVIQKKADCLSKLESSANQRSQWVADGAAELSQEQRWQELLSEMPEEVQNNWQKLRQLFADCQTENEVNGKILARKEETFGRLVKILRGQQLSADLYTAKGSRTPDGQGQKLGEA